MSDMSAPADLIEIVIRPGGRDLWKAGMYFATEESGRVDLDRGIYLIHEAQTYDSESGTQKLLVERRH